MRWVKRGLWVAAWGCWVWCGLGLCHQLPRSPRPVLSLALEPKSQVLGFIEPTDRVVVLAPDESQVCRVNVFDAETGVLVRSERGPWPPDFVLRGPITTPFRGFLLAQPRDEEMVPRLRGGLHLLDLNREGGWRQLSGRMTTDAFLHPAKPWIVFKDEDATSTTVSVVALDLTSGRELFTHTVPPGDWLVGPPVFMTEPDRVLISMRWAHTRDDKGTGRRVEAWRVGDRPTLDWSADGFVLGELPSVAGGKVAFMEEWDVAAIDVYDFDRHCFRLSDPPRGGRPHEAMGWHLTSCGFLPPRLDTSGRRVIGGWLAELRDLENCRTLWHRNGFESVCPSSDNDHFRVFEAWSMVWNEWFPDLKFFTYAQRSMESGDLEFRLPFRLDIDPANINRARSLAVAANGDVFRLPIPPNYPLLALCQTILALPIALLWMLLRWRRKRRFRMAGAVP